MMMGVAGFCGSLKSGFLEMKTGSRVPGSKRSATWWGKGKGGKQGAPYNGSEGESLVDLSIEHVPTRKSLLSSCRACSKVCKLLQW
jgi:hypothetical protein